ncbi:hypothetical protein ACS0TY_026102 [Phlomoides rotata]
MRHPLRNSNRAHRSPKQKRIGLFHYRYTSWEAIQQRKKKRTPDVRLNAHTRN